MQKSFPTYCLCMKACLRIPWEMFDNFSSYWNQFCYPQQIFSAMVPCENIYCLSYKTSAFDLVLYKSTLTQLSLWKVFLNLLFPNVEIIVGFCEREQLQLKGKVSYETVWHSSETFYLPRSGKVMQKCRSKIKKGLMDCKTLKPLF